jgi:hypothetical protein
MAKAREPAIKSESPSMPHVGGQGDSRALWIYLVIPHVSRSGEEVNLNLEGTNLGRFRVRADTLKFVHRVPRTGKPIAETRLKLNSAEVRERIGLVQKESLQRLDDDIAILSKYLKTEGASKTTIDALNTLSNQVHTEWQTAVEQIEELFEDYEV